MPRTRVADAAPARRAPRLDEALRGGNSLGVLRLGLASAVIVGHGYELGGYGDDPLKGSTGVAVSSLAVIGFFAISGYLITRSAAGTPVIPYFWRRALRIFPGYLMALVVGGLVVGPLVWWWSRGTFDGYFSLAAGGPATYLLVNADLGVDQQGIHGLFVGTPYGQVAGSVLNGSLWTLAHEWRCYVIVGALAALGVLSRARWLVLLLTVAAQGLLAVKTSGSPLADEVLAHVPGWEGDWAVIRFTAAFLLGACLGAYAHRVPCDDRLGVLSAVLFVGGLATNQFLVVAVPAGAYLVLWAAARLPARLHVVGVRNDYSYGVYVYGFLVQQVLARAGLHELGVVPYILLALAAVAPFAYLSWHLVERPALLLKGWGPGAWSVAELRRRVRRASGPACHHGAGEDGLPATGQDDGARSSA